MQKETPMVTEKKERLEAAGWKVAGATEFLGLSEAEQVKVEEAVELARKSISPTSR